MNAEDHDATRRSYDTVAEKYAARFRDELAGKPLDRALLASLIEQSPRGAPAVGIDLSAAMVSAGRREYPDVQFREGDLLDLPAADGEFGSAEPAHVAGLLEDAGFAVEMRMERVHLPDEVDTRRGYLLARRTTGSAVPRGAEPPGELAE
ncbi:hypothetical protein OHR68_37180 [Spirillospora sp. NBC_00431]